MATKKNVIIAVLATFCLTASVFMINAFALNVTRRPATQEVTIHDSYYEWSSGNLSYYWPNGGPTWSWSHSFNTNSYNKVTVGVHSWGSTANVSVYAYIGSEKFLLDHAEIPYGSISPPYVDIFLKTYDVPGHAIEIDVNPYYPGVYNFSVGIYMTT